MANVNFGEDTLGQCTGGERLPIYEVAGIGIAEEQARQLAIALKIPVEQMFWRDGLAAFVDPHNYLAVLSVPVEPEIADAQR